MTRVSSSIIRIEAEPFPKYRPSVLLECGHPVYAPTGVHFLGWAEGADVAFPGILFLEFRGTEATRVITVGLLGKSPPARSAGGVGPYQPDQCASGAP
jgi:hypothetical protein